jgi:broad specificity phosphatase PhoE
MTRDPDLVSPRRLFVFARHAESTFNVSGRVSTDPDRAVALTDRGREQARDLGAQLAGIEIDLALITRFVRTQDTAQVALGPRRVPILIDPELDEIRAGDLDGHPLDDYWAWKESHPPGERFPNGESVNEARLRYARVLRRLLSRTEPVTLIILHELALRWIAESATGSPSLAQTTFANARPYLFGEDAVQRAAVRLEEVAGVVASDGEAYRLDITSDGP